MIWVRLIGVSGIWKDQPWLMSVDRVSEFVDVVEGHCRVCEELYITLRRSRWSRISGGCGLVAWHRSFVRKFVELVDYGITRKRILTRLGASSSEGCAAGCFLVRLGR